MITNLMLQVLPTPVATTAFSDDRLVLEKHVEVEILTRNTGARIFTDGSQKTTTGLSGAVLYKKDNDMAT